MRPVRPGGSGCRKAMSWEVLPPPCGAGPGRDLGSSTDPEGCCPGSCDPTAIAFEDVALDLTPGSGGGWTEPQEMVCLVKDPTWLSPGAGPRVSASGSRLGVRPGRFGVRGFQGL